jgi:hypothetical protein
MRVRAGHDAVRSGLVVLVLVVSDDEW